jgi:hypothetical protein
MGKDGLNISKNELFYVFLCFWGILVIEIDKTTGYAPEGEFCIPQSKVAAVGRQPVDMHIPHIVPFNRII